MKIKIAKGRFLLLRDSYFSGKENLQINLS